MEPRGIVTPEGVELDFEVAGLASRVLARLLDLAVYGAVALGLYLLAVWTVFDSETAAVVAGIVLAFAALFVVPIAVETAWRGKTVGKAAVGLRAVTTEGGPSGFRHAVDPHDAGPGGALRHVGHPGHVSRSSSPSRTSAWATWRQE